MASELARSFKEAAALAGAQDKDRATRIYSQIDLHDYYEQKYSPIFGSCLKSTDHPDTSPFSFVVAIGADGRVLRLYIDHETNSLRLCAADARKGRISPPAIRSLLHARFNEFL